MKQEISHYTEINSCFNPLTKQNNQSIISLQYQVDMIKNQHMSWP